MAASLTTLQKRAPQHPGVILKTEFLARHGITAYRVAKETGMTAQRVAEVLAGQRSITPDTDLRLSTYFDLAPGFWLRAQADYDISVAMKGIGAAIAREVTPRTRRSAALAVKGR